MIAQTVARVLGTEEITPGVFLTWYAGEDLCRAAAPGQFVMVQARPGLDPFLPRAFSFFRFRERHAEREFALLYQRVGAATAIMAAQRPGDSLLMTGPLGNGFRLRHGARHLLLIGGGVGIAPLVALADEQVARDLTVVLCFGTRAAAGAFPAALLPPEVEYVLATEDGSLGQRGLVTEAAAPYLAWADQTLACGPGPMFRSLAALVRAEGGRRAVQILMETEMGCGTGICYGCAVFTRQGVRLCCKDGPRFELLDVF